ncbi:general transcription factor iie subunit 2 [Quercus suber]|uniref:General transcription factor iie subunit 2 n=1 Tax=Quercus suber TaxID=58331 RepID=A0AAW0LKS2_QUESU
MALQEKLDRFKKQQEKCQSTLTSIAASNKAATHKSMPVPAAPSVARAPAPATRQAFTPEQINEVTYVDINANKAVFDSLRNNLKVNYDGKRFSYKSKHDLRDKEQLLYLIRKFVWGIAVIDLKDAYPTVMEDLQMALQEKLDRFKKQQEKCQSTLTSIAASNKAETHKSMPVPAAPSVARAPAPATRQAFTPEQINEVTYVDINANKAVFDSLRNNLKVNYDGKRFSYKSKHDLRDKEQLLYLIRKFVWGIAVIDLKDAYPTVMEDLQALKAAGQIWLLSNFDSQEDIAYPNDPRLFLGIELPRDMIDIERDLQKNGMKPATNTAQRRASSEVQGMSSKPKPKKKKHEITKRTKLTNAHLPELFRHLDKKS